jgi:hypothetical protein
MADMIDPIHFQDLEKRNPQEVCRRAICNYSPEEKSYTLTAWGENYRLAPQAGIIERLGPQPTRDHGYLSLFLLHYLLAAEEMVLEKTWISEKEIPGGATFFRGPHTLPTHLITDRFNNDLEAFGQRCEQLHGTRLELADVAYRFEITARVPVAALYWCGDEDFPAEAKLLFDKNIGRFLAADVVFALAVGICERLGR